MFHLFFVQFHGVVRLQETEVGVLVNISSTGVAEGSTTHVISTIPMVLVGAHAFDDL